MLAGSAGLLGAVAWRTQGSGGYHLNWPDRRPIGSLFLANSENRSATNPRGWLYDPRLDVTTAAGRDDFAARVLAWADQSVRILQDMQAQGMITWDVEGQEFDHPITYIGDPRLVEQRAPEIAPVIDAYFRKFRDAGLRVGMTIRAQQFVIDEQGVPTQRRPRGPAEILRTLSEKIDYARQRWGATMFHVDSNGDPNFPYAPRLMQQVAAAHPDVLLVPEHETPGYYTFSAPYHELDRPYFITSTPPLIRSRNPQAFSVIQVADGDPAAYRVWLVQAVRAGDVLMFRGWFDSEENAAVKSIYAEAYKQ